MPERIQKTPLQLRKSPFSLAAIFDQVFFVFAGVASFWLAWLVFREAWHTGVWWMAVLFMVVWAVVAYLALPRAHRILSSWYVPNYFFGRTLTADGLVGDPVNVALTGTEAQLHHAFQSAGWHLAEEITLRSAFRTVVSTIRGTSFPSAPVSSLFLFGRRHDFAYQQEVDGSPHKRHHIRVWRCPAGWLLPGGHKVDWLAAATFDRSVGLSLFTFQITHKIDEDIDIERDYVVGSLELVQGVQVRLIKDFSTGYHSRNGGGDSIKTDGDLPVVDLSRAKVDLVDSDDYEVPVVPYAAEGDESLLLQLWQKRPPQILVGSILVVVATTLSLVALAGDVLNWAPLSKLGAIADQGMGIGVFLSAIAADSDSLTRIAIIVSSIMAIIELYLALRVLRGGGRSRTVLLAIASITVLVGLLGFGASPGYVPIELLFFIGFHLMIVMAYSSDSARKYANVRARVVKS